MNMTACNDVSDLMTGAMRLNGLVMLMPTSALSKAQQGSYRHSCWSLKGLTRCASSTAARREKMPRKALLGYNNLDNRNVVNGVLGASIGRVADGTLSPPGLS